MYVYYNILLYILYYFDDAYIVYILNVIHVPVFQRKYIKYVFNYEIISSEYSPDTSHRVHTTRSYSML